MERQYINRRNPILPLDIHIPDGEAHVMPDGNLYIYGSLDLQPDDYCSNQYRVVSTNDMIHWNIHPVSMVAEEVKWKENIDISKYPDFYQEEMTPLLKKILANGDIPTDPYESENYDKEKKEFLKGKKLLFAPDAIYHNGKYFLYFCTSDGSEGVATSDYPQGPFADYVKLPCRGIDPAVFIDEDGQGYYYWGQFYSHAVALNQDMMSFSQENVKNHVLTEREHFFHEGCSMRKIEDTYYAVYSNMERGRPTSIGYATSKSPLGPFRYRGIIVDNQGCDPQSWNNHGSIECFHGKWYVFYHRCSRNTRIFRRLCIEPITICPDGTIDEVVMTSQGIGKPFSINEEIMGYQACKLVGNLYIDVNDEHGEVLTNIDVGNKAYFRYVEHEHAYKEIWFLCEGSGEIEVIMNGEVINRYEIVNGIQDSSCFIVPAGIYEVVLSFTESVDLQFIGFYLLG